ncbi:restriction endonuclease subunit S [Aeromonas veronii]
MKLYLYQIATISAGYPFRGKIPEYPEGNLAVVQMKDSSSEFGVDWMGCVRSEATGKKAPDWLQTGDILVAARGNQNYAVLVDTRHAPLPAVAAPHFYVVRPQSDALIPEFLAWQLNQQPCQRYFELHAEGTLTKSIRRQVLEEALIGLPSLAEQQTILAMARTLQEERQLMQRLQHNSEQMMHAIATRLLEPSDADAS